MYRQLQSLASQQIRQLEPDTRIVIIHPNFRHQHALLGRIFPSVTVYHRFDKDNSVSPGTQLAESIKDQTGSAELPDDATIVLDECDNLNNDALEQLLAELIAATAKFRIFVFSRGNPLFISRNPKWKAISTFIPVDESSLLLDYTSIKAEPENLLEVRSFSEGRVMVNGKPVDNWDGVLPRSLFFYLVDRGMATRADIFLTFWPDLPAREATNVFHVTKRKISEILGIDLTTYWSGFYRISPNIQLSYDVVHFSELLQTSAIAEPDEAEQQLRRAISLYRDHFLSSLDNEWAALRRNQLAFDYAEALQDLGDLLVQTGNINEAIGFYLRAITISEDRIRIAKQVLNLYKDMNHHTAAIDLCRKLLEFDQNSNQDYTESLHELVSSVEQEIGHSVA